MIKKFLLLASMLSLLSMGLMGCNTMRGMGEDVSAAGGAVEHSAEKNKSY